MFISKLQLLERNFIPYRGREHVALLLLGVSAFAALIALVLFHNRLFAGSHDLAIEAVAAMVIAEILIVLPNLSLLDAGYAVPEKHANKVENLHLASLFWVVFSSIMIFGLLAQHVSDHGSNPTSDLWSVRPLMWILWINLIIITTTTHLYIKTAAYRRRQREEARQ